MSTKTIHCGALLALISLSTVAHAAIQTVGGVTGVNVTTNAAGNVQADFTLGTGGIVQVTPYAADCVRVRFHWLGLWDKEELIIAKPFENWANAGATFSDQGATYLISTPQLDVVVDKNPFRVHFKNKAGVTLLQDDRIEYDPDYHPLNDPTYPSIRENPTLPTGFKLKSIKVMATNEAFFGLGLYSGPLNRRGHSIQQYSSDTYTWQEFRNPSYMSLPFFYGVRGSTAYGILFNNSSRMVFRMGSQWNDKYSFESGDGQMDYFFFGGGSNHTMPKVLDRYSELTGRPTFLPKWAFGYHQSRFSYLNQNWIKWLASEFRNQDFPLDALYLDIDYMDVDANEYFWDSTLRQLTMNYNFNDTPGMIQHCEDRGVKVVPLIEPWLNNTDPLWTEAINAGHLVKNNDGSTYNILHWFGQASWIDFSSTPARDWWKTKVLGFLNQYAFAGIWNDLNEPASNDPYSKIPLNALYWLDGRYGTGNSDTRRWEQNEHQNYAVREVSLTYDILKTKYPNKRPFVLSRSGLPGVQRYALNWSGDNTASWDHARHNIGLGASVMISGQPNFGHDLGGFIGSTTGELLTRWTEWGALTPFCRNHAQKNTGEREPWRFGEPYTSAMRDSIKFRYKLMPYLYSLVWKSTLTGEPMNAPTVFYFTSDAATHFMNNNDFMVGPSMLAAPVYSQGATTRSVYLPYGTSWYSWHDNAKYDGGQTVTVGAPLGKIPLFVRDGAIVPMSASMKHMNEFKPNYLDIQVWPSGTSSFDLYEDDGESFDYQSGEYALTRMSSVATSNSWTFTLAAREGSYDPGTRSLYIYANKPRGVSSVTLNGQPLAAVVSLGSATNGWMMTTGNRLAIKIPDTGTSNVLNVIWNDSAYFAMSVAGTFNNWNTYGNMVMTNAGQWSYDVTVTNASGQRFKFVGNRSWSVAWGDLNQNAFSNPISGTADSTGGDIVSTELMHGTYRFTFNEQSLGYSVTRIRGGALQWAGNAYHWPSNGSITSNNDIWVNAETWPRGAASSGFVAYSTNNGASWQSKPMALAGRVGNNDWWNCKLGKFPTGTQIRYAIALTDSFGRTIWLNNGQQDYRANVN